MNSKEYTFKDLFCTEETGLSIKKIEIPIIQRDYAQGRLNKESTRVREKFLDAIYTHITENEHLTLDFVYGDIKENVLTPLDGQQRLTTLFLLYWYAAKKEEIAPEDYEFLKNFSYSTRFSSRDFCKALIEYTPDFTAEELSGDIINQAWYPYDWKYDPTIQSMLEMIDAIHRKFMNVHNIWSSLANISFFFLKLEDMGLSDDLYIKMNSRGKPLTDFEHFKAEFLRVLGQHSDELPVRIGRKFDIDWTDMLFPFRGENSIIDDEFLRYFLFVSDIICYERGDGIESERDVFTIANKLYGKLCDDKTANKNAPSNIDFLEKYYDCWCGFDIEKFFCKYFSHNSYEQNKVAIYTANINVFKECCDNYGEYIDKARRNRKFPLARVILLYAVITYLQNKETISEDLFIRRIRIIRNLVENSINEIREDRMKTILSETKHIITKGDIPDMNAENLGFSASQKREEQQKLEWLKKNIHMADKLFELEDSIFLRGCISIVGLDNTANFNKFRLLFNMSDKKDLINRALLAVGDYSQFLPTSYGRNQIGAERNDSVWQSLFHPSEQRKGFDDTSKTLNALLSMLDETHINDTSLLKIINDYLQNSNTTMDWRYYFVKYEQMRIGSNYGFYYCKDKEKLSSNTYEILMISTEKAIGRNWNVFLRTLFYMPEFIDKLDLDDYAYYTDKEQGNRLRIKNTDISIKCLNDRYEIYHGDSVPEIKMIRQTDGIDAEDRIDVGIALINDLLKK